jgi:hypothetical protein
MAREVMTREAFERPYRHPYRHWIPRAWEMTNARFSMILGTGAAGALTVAALATGLEGLALSGAIVETATLGTLGYLSARAALIVRRITRPRREPSELRRVREGRPHRGERDPDLAHDEYAVSVEEHGELYLWCFRPLHIDSAHPEEGDDWIVVPGVPEYVAQVVDAWPYDPRDAGRAAEQLAEAQAEAAAYEAAAIEDTRRRYEAQLAEAEIAEEGRPRHGRGAPADHGSGPVSYLVVLGSTGSATGHGVLAERL